jgi:hypothetical protein
MASVSSASSLRFLAVIAMLADGSSISAVFVNSALMPFVARKEVNDLGESTALSGSIGSTPGALLAALIMVVGRSVWIEMKLKKSLVSAAIMLLDVRGGQRKKHGSTLNR